MVYFLLFLVGWGCARVPRDQEKCLRADLLRPLTTNLLEDVPAAPYFTHYSKGGRNLTFLAAEHDPRPDGPTQMLIVDLFKRFRPDKVVVELSTHDEERLKESLKRCRMGVVCPESIFTYHLAREGGIEVSGGEPPETKVLQESMARGLKEEEVLFFFVMRGVAAWKAKHAPAPGVPRDPKGQIMKMIDFQKKLLHLGKSSFDFQAFLTAYKERMGRSFMPESVRYEDIAPYEDGHSIQRLSAAIGRSREAGILEEVERSLKGARRVMVVYGEGHYRKQRAAIEECFGPPVPSGE